MNETQIGQLVIDLQIKTNALEKGIETAKKKLQEIEKQNDELKSSNNSLDASFIAMSAGIIGSLVKITSAIKSAVDEYKAYEQAMSSLQNVADYTGESMSDLSSIMDKYEGIMTKSDLATTIKNFSLMGMTAKQTEQMIEALTNSAIRNRNANYTVSEAVRVASEGYRQGLSTLSDSAGVTENLSVMLDNYAKSIGKTASKLTEEEKNQAYLNRTMAAAEPFAGAMAEYLDSLAGKQGEYSQAMRETQVAYTESIEPLLIKFENFKTTMISGLGDIISSHEGATAGVTTFVIALGTLTISITAIKKAYDMYKASTIAATISTQGFTAALAANPIGAVAIAISLVVAAFATYTTATEKQAEAQQILNEREEQYKNILSGKQGYTQEEISSAKDRVSEIEKEIDYLNQIIKKRQEVQQLRITIGNSKETKQSEKELNDLIKKYEELSKKAPGTYKDIQDSLNGLNKELNETKKYLNEANAVEEISKGLDTDAIKKKQEEAAQLKVNTQTMQEYLNIVKKGKTSTSEYQEAVKQLAQAYPEAANAEGIIIDQAQNLINAEELKADTAWNASQTTIQSYIDIINAALQSESTQRQIAQNIGISWEQVVPKLQSVLAVLQTMAGYQPTDVPNITPKVISRPRTTSSSKTYQNKALDNYKKQIEHKKSLDQLSLQQEISMYQTALKKYAKTADEKMELEEKIYSLRKELQEKNLDDYVEEIEHKKALDQLSLQQEIQMYEKALNNYAKTTEQKKEIEETLYDLRKELQEKILEDYTNEIQHRKSMGQLNLQQEISMYKTALNNYAKTAEQRKEIEETIYSLQQELQEQELNNYISEIQYKKSLDQLTLQQEIKMYQEALNNYAKTSDQKKEIRQTIYELNKELAQKEKEILDQQTEDYETYIQNQKNLRGAAYDVNEQLKDYDKIISMHRNYLNQIMKDERLSLDQRKELYREELATIRNYEQQKRDLRVESVDNTLSQLTNAITKQLEEMQEKDKEMIDKNLEAVEKWKDARIKAINEEYDARIETIEKELNALDEAEEEKNRAEEDAEYERKKNRLEELIAFEHDATNRANYQKELDSLIAEHQKTLDDRALQDKKDALNEQKKLLKEEQDNTVQAIEDEADKQKEAYEKQLDELEKYYDEQIDMAQETAEKMLLNVQKNQDQILNLLKKYGDKYELTGQTLGEKLAQGINNGIADKIKDIIQKIQDTIDANLEAKIKEWTSSNYKYEANADKPKTSTINVTQNNYIENTPEMPSETYRKFNNTTQKLAEELAGI